MKINLGRSFIIIMISLLSLIFAPGAFSANTNSVHEYQLKNGLKIILKPINRAPVIVSQLCYHVGSSYEPDGLTGISHMLEHMMFKGTIKHPAGEFSRIVAMNGGQENAYTSYDYTCYFQQIESSRLPVVLELEADRMRNLALNEQEFAKEKQVVMEERRMRIEDNPQARMYERFTATAHLRFGYHHPTIGWMSDINQLTLQNLQQWYQLWYAPNNATLILVGRIDPDKTLEQVKKYFEPIPTSKIIPPPAIHSIPPLASRELNMRIPAQIPMLIMGYNVPNLRELNQIGLQKDAYALELIAVLLAGGESAQLPRELVRNQNLAVSIDADYDLYTRLPGLFTIEVVPATSNGHDKVMKEIDKIIQSLQQTPVSLQELTRARARLIAKKVYKQDSLFSQAIRYGSLESVGLSWRQDEDYINRIKQITPEDIQAASKKYLINDAKTIARLHPINTINSSQALPLNSRGTHVN